MSSLRTLPSTLSKLRFATSPFLPTPPSIGNRIATTPQPTPRPIHTKFSEMAGGPALPHLDPITRLSPVVIRILGHNPGKFTLQGTNTYLIGSGAQRILIDTGEGKAGWKNSLQQTLKDENASVSQVVLTHWHPDHVGGIKDVLELCAGAEVFKCQPVNGQKGIENGDVFRTEGATLRAFHSPGHTVDHMALVLEEEESMFTGDNVLGHGTAVFEDLATYLNSLERMEKEFTKRAYPGHGEVIGDGRAKIREYISHRREREEQILKVMGQHPEEGQGWSSMGIVKVVYVGYPENLHLPAEKGVVQVLQKLEGEGRVNRDGAGNWVMTQKSSL